MASFGQALQEIMLDLTQGFPESLQDNGNTTKEQGTSKAARNRAPSRSAQTKARKKNGRLPRRSNKELEQMADRVEKLLRDKGQPMRVEAINAELGTTTRELMRPIKKLLESNRIKRNGERRSTVYFVE